MMPILTRPFHGRLMVLHPPAPSPVTNISSYMAKLAWEPTVWDVVIVCEGHEFKGTRSILSRVPFFEAALAGGFQEGGAARVEIRDAGVAAFRIVWHYLYTDDCSRVANLAAAELLDVLSLAKRFELPVVAQACSRRLVELVPALPAGTLVDVFRAALLHELRTLRDACHNRVGEVG